MGFWQFATGGGSGGGTGDVVGPASSTDNAIARFDGATGKLLQNSGVTVADGLTGGVIVGSTGATDNAILRADGTGGATLQNSGASVADDGMVVSGAATYTTSFKVGTHAGIGWDQRNVLGSTNNDWVRATDGDAGLSGFYTQTIGSGDGPGQLRVLASHTLGLALGSGIPLKWANATDIDGTAASPFTADTGLARSAAGVVKVTDGSTGNGAVTASQFQVLNGAVVRGSFVSAAAYGMTLADGQFFSWDPSSGAADGYNADLRLGRLGDGQLSVRGGAGGTLRGAINIRTVSTTVNASGATSTATNLVPAGCILLGVTTLVTTAITSGDGGTSVNIGNGTDADMYGATIAFALGTTTNLASHTASALAWKSAAESVVFTCVGGTFNGGVWRVCAHYLDLTAPTS